jgi:aryl sulfotransferase
VPGVTSALVRYRNVVFDSDRWVGFPFRADDIVISTPPKSGTTWVQTICAMLVFDAVTFDRPLAEISPWLDMQTNSVAQVMGWLQAEEHRRFIKTHTPLDGIPLVDGVTYVCVGRDPRDVAMSFQHHWSNLDHDAFMGARARAVGLDDLAELGPPPTLPEDPAERFRLWVDAAPNTFVGPALVDVLHHVDTFWTHRHDPGVVLIHYDDLLADLPVEIRRLADALGVDAAGDRIQDYATAAGFAQMKERADDLVPDVANRIWRSNEAFFHRGASGQWRDLITDEDARHYDTRVAELVAPDVAAWAHRGRSGLDLATTPDRS